MKLNMYQYNLDDVSGGAWIKPCRIATFVAIALLLLAIIILLAAQPFKGRMDFGTVSLSVNHFVILIALAPATLMAIFTYVQGTFYQFRYPHTCQERKDESPYC